MNKWIIGFVAVLLFVTPAMAVIITAAPDPENPCKIIVEYTKEAEEDIIRAFALDLEVNECNCIFVGIEDLSSDYWVYPGQIVIEDGEVTDEGTPDANGNDYPGTLTGLGTQGVTVEMGSLYAGNDPCHPIAPAPAGILFSFVVDRDCNVIISENTARGGIVLEDASSAVSNLPISILIEDCNACGCYNGPDLREWSTVGAPDSWCCPTQCHGDADCAQEKISRGWFYVGYNDIAILLAGFNKAYSDPVTHPWISADFDHRPEKISRGWFRVGYNDIAILVTYFNKSVVPADCNP